MTTTTRPSSVGKSLSELDIRYELQPAAEGSRLPYPINLDPDFFVVGWRGPVDEGDKLIGFQMRGVQSIALHTEEFVAAPYRAVGLSPVFSDGKGFYALDCTLSEVTVVPPKEEADPVYRVRVTSEATVKLSELKAKFPGQDFSDMTEEDVKDLLSSSGYEWVSAIVGIPEVSVKDIGNVRTR